jgi:hypothetical protein
MKMRFILFAATALLAHGETRAQDSTAHNVTISIGGGYEQTVIDNGARLTMPDPEGVAGEYAYLVLDDAPVIGYDIRGSIAYKVAPMFEVGARLELSHLSRSSQWSYTTAVLIQNRDGFPVLVHEDIALREIFIMETRRLDLLARYRLPLAGLAVEGGIISADRRFLKVRRTRDLNAPDDARLSNPDSLPTEYDGRRLVFYDGTWPEANHFVPGAFVGLSCTIPITEDFSIVPQALLRKEFTPPDRSAPWPSWFASGGLSIAYTF